MPYTLKPDNNVICQCGAIVSKYYYRTHIQTAKHEWYSIRVSKETYKVKKDLILYYRTHTQTAKHERDMIGRENIEVGDH
jgi:hypothetical protein